MVEALIGWADVVLHNFRVGVRAPQHRRGHRRPPQIHRAVYCPPAPSAPTAPALLPGNDALMQAVTGFERAVGGEGNDPIAGTWIPPTWRAVGWPVSACSPRPVRPGHLARWRRGQQVAIPARRGMLSRAACTCATALVRGPQLDGDQSGYGPGGLPAYRAGRRVARGRHPRRRRVGGRGWLPEVVAARRAARGLTPCAAAPNDADARAGGGCSPPRGRRHHGGGLGRPAHALGALAEPSPTSSGTRSVAASSTIRPTRPPPIGRLRDRRTGVTSSRSAPLRLGPDAGTGPELELPGIGEHSVEVLTELQVRRGDRRVPAGERRRPPARPSLIARQAGWSFTRG